MQVNMHEAKARLSELVEKVKNGESIIIAKSGKPVAEIKLYIPKREYGKYKHKIKFDIEEFNSMDDEISDMFYGDDK